MNTDKVIFRILVLQFFFTVQASYSDEWTVFSPLTVGLHGGYVTRMAIDREGYMWIGASSGICRFDGENFKSFPQIYFNTPTSNGLNSLVVDSLNNVWAGFNSGHDLQGGYLKFDGSKAEYFSKPTTSLVVENDGTVLSGDLEGLAQFNGSGWDDLDIPVKPALIQEMKTANKKVYMACLEGLIIKDGNNYQYYNKNNSSISVSRFITVAVDHRNNIWLGGMEGLVKYQNNRSELYTTGNSILSSDMINSLAVDTANTLWVGTSSGLYSVDGDRWQSHVVPGEDPNWQKIEDLLVDADNRIWVGTWQGLACFHENQWTLFDAKGNSLSADFYMGVKEAQNGNLWFYDYRSFSTVNSFQWKTWLAKEFYEDWNEWNFTAMAVDSMNDTWIAFHTQAEFPPGSRSWEYMGGLIQIHEGKIGIWGPQSLQYLKPITFLQVDKSNNRWMGTVDGLVVMNGKTVSRINLEKSGLANLKTRCLAFDGSGSYWLGTEGGIGRFNGLEWTVYTVSNSPLPSNTIQTIAIDSNHVIWIGTDRGLAILDHGSWTIYNTANSVLPSDNITDIEIHDDTVWLGAHSIWYWGHDSGGGLVKVMGDRWQVITRLSAFGIPESEKTSVEKINDLEIDSKGNLWIATSPISPGSDLPFVLGGGYFVYNENGVDLPEPQEKKGDFKSYVYKTKDLPNNAEFAIFPNPSKFNTVFKYRLNDDTQVSLGIFNILGEQILELVSESQLKGVHEAFWDGLDSNGSTMSNGVYFCRFERGSKITAKRFTLIR